ncbi:pyrimidine reductase family protein [Nocardiopsis sp. FIRDI 009]|uniref:pyrimidine reductase family protein n=1 Tax=Nocardiopsis sp. FIRDI 009 TaxID=714197 RepID=UPI0018E4F8EF|nr:pyrimidine reductase family protein [Nocardiopsis sp. FIRDI 009]
MVVRLLLNDVVPGAADPGDRLGPDDLERLYAYPDVTARPWVRANMVATLDGAAAGNDGRTGSINTAADLVVYTLLRDLADVILVGAGTARSEGYRRTPPRSARFLDRAAAEGRPSCPVTAVVSGAAQVPPLLAADAPDHGDVLLVTCAGAGPEALDRARRLLGSDRVIVVGAQSVDLPAAVDALHARGLPRILCEGGPRLLRDVAAADALDELCLTVVPLLAAGVQQRVTAGAGVDRALVPRLVIEQDGTLLHRWMRP